jgi:hypothetical protein
VRYIFLLGISFLVFPLGLFSQVIQPEYGLVFPQDEVSVVRITLHPDSLPVLLELGQAGSEHEFQANFRFESSNFSQTIQNIGFRLRGNTSLNAAKKSFKISFNTFIKGARWQGLEKINLNGSHNDPTRIRTKLCWEMLRKAELPAARTAMVQLFVNEQNMGLYTHVEHIDETFVERVFSNPHPGNLYKCLYPADLDYISENPAAYQLDFNGRRVYELKTNEYADNYSDLSEFISILNQTDLENLPCALEPIFQVDRYLKQAAFDVLSGNWDGYIFNKNNFYLYKNRNSGQFEFIHYDLDNTLGIDWVNQDWSNRSIYAWAPQSQERPLFKRLLQIPQYRNRFSYYVDDLMQSVFHPDSLRQRINYLQDLIAPVVNEDPFHGLDYGFTFDDFYHGDSLAWGGHVEFGILPFVVARNVSAINQLDAIISPDVAILSAEVGHDFPLNDTIRFMAQCTHGIDSLLLEYGYSVNTFSANLVALDDGVFPDVAANDHIYTARLQNVQPAERLYYRWRIPGRPEVYPCSGDFVHLNSAASSLFINEVMSENTGVVFDDLNNTTDWIELWNGGFSGVNLKGYYLSDDATNPLKFELANGFMTTGQFNLFWADNEPLNGPEHCSFSLDNDGEELRLYKLEDGKPRLYDRIEFPALYENFSWGRIQDGAESWIVFESSTPGGSNQSTGISDIENIQLLIFPNPGSEILHLSRTLKFFQVLDISGRMHLSGCNTNLLDASDLASGMYVLVSDLGVCRFSVENGLK